MAPLMTMPDLETPCGNCGDVFARHWISHDGETQGCLATKVDIEGPGKPREVKTACGCKGFTVVWTPPSTIELRGLPAPSGYETEDSYPSQHITFTRPDRDPDDAPEPGAVVGRQWEPT